MDIYCRRFVNFALSLIAVLSVWNASICLELLLLLFGVTDPTVHIGRTHHIYIISYLLSVSQYRNHNCCYHNHIACVQLYWEYAVCKGCMGRDMQKLLTSWEICRIINSTWKQFLFISFIIAVHTYRSV